MDDLVVRPDELQRYVEGIFAGLGAEEWSARAAAACLVRGDLDGYPSHGVHLVDYWAQLSRSGQLDLNARPAITHDHGAVIRLDGNHALGPVVATHAAELAAERARQHGIALVLARDGNHAGRLGIYTEALADDGFAAILLCACQGGSQMLGMAGGLDRRLANNPISLAVPAGDDPVVLDLALSAIAYGKVELAQARGEPVPEGTIVDRDGRPSTDPNDYFAGGMLLPLGGLLSGHKAAGLIVMIDLIAGLLADAGAPGPDTEDFYNALAIVAIDIAPLRDPRDYAAEVEELRGYLKSSRRAPGVEEILLPGERAARTRRRRSDEGIPLDTPTRAALAAMAAEVGVAAL